MDSLIQIHPINLFCEGNESNLKDCPREEFSLDQISEDDDMFKVAAVRCQG